MLEMLHAIIVKFPSKNVDEQSQTLFVHLVVCLANDQDNRVRSMTGAAIKKLIGCVSSHSLHSILEYTLSWYSEETQQLWSAAAQVIISELHYDVDNSDLGGPVTALVVITIKHIFLAFSFSRHYSFIYMVECNSFIVADKIRQTKICKLTNSTS